MPRTLSPLSVPYRVLRRGGGAAVALAFVLVGGSGDLPLVGGAGWIVVLAVAGIGGAALVAYETAYVRRFSYELTADTLDIDSGVFARRSREIPLRRIQNVDISRNVVQRALGIAVVAFETAGGSETEAEFRYVSFAEAKRLQRELARLKRAGSGGTDASGDETGIGASPGTGAETGPGAGAGAAALETTELFALDRSELAVLGALSVDLRVPGVLFALVSTVGSTIVPASLSTAATATLLAVAALVLVGLALASWLVGAAVAIVEYYDFRLVRSGEELQYERGLLQRYDGSIPFDKIQTLTIVDNPLKRHFGYATLYIETAGYTTGGGDGSRGSEAAIPIAERERVRELVEELEPVGDVEFRRPPAAARRRSLVRYLLVVALAAAGLYAVRAVASLPVPWWGALAAVPIAVWFAAATWRHRGHWLGETHVVTRNGVLRRETKIVPYYRVQTVIDSRTIFQRRLGLATVTVDTAGSLSIRGQDAAAVDVAGTRADELRDELEARLTRAVDAYRAGRTGIGTDGTDDTDGDGDPDD
ncbi:MAG: PH domain-containing protein [Haloquadratum sp.]